jgi:spermidine/putrescine transport system ATP-binding protein
MAVPEETEASEISDPSVRLENILKTFGSLTAVNDISLDVFEGEFFTILGPSGSGKSTLLEIIAGIQRPDSGSISINGEDMTTMPPEKRPTNLVFQNLALFPHKNVYENIEFGLKMQGVPPDDRRQQSEDMLSLLDLDGYGDNEIEELSGGEQQRVALGRALLSEPDVLLLDEPLSSLDRKLKEDMQLELRRIHQELSTTFVYVTHDQEIALTASDRIGIIHDGDLIQVGTPEDIYEHPANRFVADFIGDTNLLSGEVVGVTGNRLEVEIGDEALVVLEGGSERGISSGTRVDLSVRPEDITIGDGARELDNSYAGTVVDRIYRGDRLRYEVTLPWSDIEVKKPHLMSGGQEFRAGQEVRVGWSATDISIVRGD